MKKLAFLCITLLLCVGLLAACGNVASAVSSSAPQPVSVTDESKAKLADNILTDTANNDQVILLLQYDELAEKLKSETLTAEEREEIELQMQEIKEKIQ